METREGKITKVNTGGETGELMDHASGAIRDFVNPAKVTIKVNDEVIYISVVVVPPSGPERIINVLKEIKIAA